MAVGICVFEGEAVDGVSCSPECFAASAQGRRDDKVDDIDEIGVEQRPRDFDGAVNADVAACAALQGLNILIQRALDGHRVGPRGVQVPRCRDVPLGRVDERRERLDVALGPVTGPVVIGLAPENDVVLALDDPGEVCEDLGPAVKEPVAGFLGDAVEDLDRLEPAQWPQSDGSDPHREPPDSPTPRWQRAILGTAAHHAQTPLRRDHCRPPGPIR